VSTYNKLVIVAIIYFSEGFPNGIIKDTLPTYFRISGMPLEHIGYLSALSLPYALKFLWSPAVDFLGTRRGWIVSAQFLMAVLVLLLIPLDPAHPNFCLWVVMAALAIMSATQDIAIDAYSIEMLQLSEMGMANGVRLAAYKVAIVVAGSFLVALGGRIGWTTVYLGASAILLVLAFGSLRLPPLDVKRKAASLSSFVEPLRDILSRPGLVQVIAFILLYKAGDVAIAPMIRPFWVDWGFSTDTIGLAGTIGVASSVAGGLAGGMFISRWGIFHALWFLGFWQTAGNLLYAWVAASPGPWTWGVYCATGVDSFVGGAGTAAFLAFLMSICKKQYSATQYALLSSLFQMPAVLLGVCSGEFVAALGYAWFFVITFVMGLPGLGFVFHARRWIRTNGDSVKAP
jgi:MFS transporter, PAT family, beta-lactamase induction signal transducer AmpG